MTGSALLLLYLAVTGLMMQGVDFFALLAPTPQNAADRLSIKEYSAGPPYFSILTSVDEAGAALDPTQMQAYLNNGFAAAARALPDAPVTSIELRVVDGVPQAVVLAGASDARALTFDARTGVQIGDRPALSPPEPQSTHDAIKDWHRGNIVGQTGVWINLLLGVCLLVLCLTGIWMYLQMLQRRRRQGRHGLFWG